MSSFVEDTAPSAAAPFPLAPDDLSAGGLTEERGLTEKEADRLGRCEAAIEAGLHTFYAVGNALMTIREARLYRATHATFAAYCVGRWGMSRSNADRMIVAAEVAANLTPIGVVLTSESQARPLASLSPEAQREVGVRLAGAPGPLTAAKVQEAVTQTFPQSAPAVVDDAMDGEGVEEEGVDDAPREIPEPPAAAVFPARSPARPERATADAGGDVPGRPASGPLPAHDAPAPGRAADGAPAPGLADADDTRPSAETALQPVSSPLTPALGAVPAQALPNLNSLPYDSYVSLHRGGTPAGCSPECACRGRALFLGREVAICTAPGHYRALQGAVTRGEQKERKGRFSVLRDRIVDAVPFDRPDPRGLAIVAWSLIRNAKADAKREVAARLGQAPEGFGVGPDVVALLTAPGFGVDAEKAWDVLSRLSPAQLIGLASEVALREELLDRYEWKSDATLMVNWYLRDRPAPEERLIDERPPASPESPDGYFCFRCGDPLPRECFDSIAPDLLDRFDLGGVPAIRMTSGELLTKKGAYYCEECSPDVQTCRVCGCTEEAACVEVRDGNIQHRVEGGCSWVQKDPENPDNCLCSACVGKAAPASRDGAPAADAAPPTFAVGDRVRGHWGEDDGRGVPARNGTVRQVTGGGGGATIHVADSKGAVYLSSPERLTRLDTAPDSFDAAPNAAAGRDESGAQRILLDDGEPLDIGVYEPRGKGAARV